MMVQLMVRLWSLEWFVIKEFWPEGKDWMWQFNMKKIGHKIGHKPHTAVPPVQGGYKREERDQPADGE